MAGSQRRVQVQQVAVARPGTEETWQLATEAGPGSVPVICVTSEGSLPISGPDKGPQSVRNGLWAQTSEFCGSLRPDRARMNEWVMAQLWARGHTLTLAAFGGVQVRAGEHPGVPKSM